MVSQQINIAELLKDSPKGTELHSDIQGAVFLNRVKNDQIYVCTSKEESLKESFECLTTFYTSSGRAIIGGAETYAPMLFPSEEVRDWIYFGVLWIRGNYQRTTEIINILQKHGGEDLEEIVESCGPDCILFINPITKSVDWVCDYSPEYQIVIQYGTELKLEEKEQPKFQVGDAVVENGKVVGEVITVGEKALGCYNYSDSHKRASISIENLRLATEEEIDRWNKETLHPNHMHYSKNKRKIIENWLLPFDRVIGRIGSNHKWEINLFDHYEEDELSNPAYNQFPYHCLSEKYAYCLPYNEETMELVGTTNDYKEK